jgi:diguanylate cyclase (GGDEF)-like protein
MSVPNLVDSTPAEPQPGVFVSRLGELEGAVVAPLLVRSELIGILVLGAKENAERFPAEELELLDLLTHHVATVFQNARLFESATYESLTGLLRREAVVEILEKEIVRARRHGRPLTVGMADLDRFKEVNDRYGHLAGDTLLQRVAGVLTAGMRESDAVGRYGGEEFLLVLPETDLAGGRVVADKLRQRVEEVRMPMTDGRDARVTISIGMASLESDGLPEEVTARDLLLLADKALYRAKEQGRNRVHPPRIARAG